MMEFSRWVNGQKVPPYNIQNKFHPQNSSMPRRNHKQPRKSSYEESHSRVRYQEKQYGVWRCSVCEQVYAQDCQYCLTCYQSLYYFSYINNQLFVTKDDSYLETYFHQPVEDASSMHSHSHEELELSDNGSEEVNLEWVENLLM